MIINLVVDSGIIRAALQGAIDSSTAPSLQETLLAAIAEHRCGVELDLGQVPYVSSAGLRVLVLAAKELRPIGRRVRLVGVSGSVLQVLQLANFGAFLDIEPVD